MMEYWKTMKAAYAEASTWALLVSYALVFVISYTATGAIMTWLFG